MHLIWHSCKCRRRNHLWQMFWWSVEGCRFCKGSKIAISHWLSQWPLTQGWRYRAACDLNTEQNEADGTKMVNDKRRFLSTLRSYYFTPGTGARYCHQRVCLSVWSHIDSAMCYAVPVWWRTSCFRITKPMGQIQRRRNVSSGSPGGGTRAMVYSLFILLLLLLVLMT